MARRGVSNRVLRETKVLELRCDLTDEEIRKRGEELANQHQRIAELEEHKRQVAKEFKGKIDEHRTTANDLAKEIAQRATYREVETKLWLDIDAGMAELVRLDTGEVYHRRPLRPDERQGRLFEMPADEEGGA